MTSLIVLTALCNFALTGGNVLAGIAHHQLLVMQDRIVLRSGQGGGVTIRPDPTRHNRSYEHSSRPLFGTQTAHAARYSSRRRYTPADPPLITSREVARESVRRSLYGNRWGW